MNEQEFDQWLDDCVGKLPRSIDPQNDLWPGIHARLAERDAPVTDEGARWSRVWPFSAGVAATALVAIMTLQITRERSDTTPIAEVRETPVIEFAVEPPWVPDILRTGNELRADYEASLDNLAPETRAIVEANLKQIHDSLAQIHEALSQDPSNAALHRLLAGTYQQELSLFSSIGALNKMDVEL